MTTGDTAVVVGGGSGMGEAVVAAYRAAGRDPIVWDIGGAHDIECDVRDPAAIDAALAETIERAGVPTELTITAGVARAMLLADEAVDDWDRIMAVNTRGPWLVMRAVARALADAGAAGSMVVTSSVSGHVADVGMGTYCVSKAALNMLVRVAACEWAPSGIRVNAIAPGVTDTPMLGGTDGEWTQAVARRTPLGRIGTAGDMAALVLALHELEWVTGQVVDCDGGLALRSPMDPFGSA